MLQHILSEDYSLALSPGFFRFYAHIGILAALQEKGCLRPNALSGSSAGAMVVGFLAAGMTPAQMKEEVLKIKRVDMWDFGGMGGLLKGYLFQELVRNNLPVKTIEECATPMAVTAYDLLRFKTRSITNGEIAVAVVASCTFPGLFQPVIIDSSPHIDGGVWDQSGMMALPDAIAQRPEVSKIENKDRLVVNIVFDANLVLASKMPSSLTGSRLLTIVMENIPNVHPFSMDTMGEVAHDAAKAATLRALEGGSHIQEVEPNHWVCFIDGNTPQPSKKRSFDAANSSISSSLCSNSDLPPPPKKLVRIPSLSFVGSYHATFDDVTAHCTEEHVRAASIQNRSIVSSGSMDRLVLTDFSPSAAVPSVTVPPVPSAPVRVVSAGSASSNGSKKASPPATAISNSNISSSSGGRSKKSVLARRGSVKRFTRGTTKKNSRIV